MKPSSTCSEEYCKQIWKRFNNGVSFISILPEIILTRIIVEWKNKRYQFSNLLEALNGEAGPRVEAFLRKTLKEKPYKPRNVQSARSEDEDEEDDSWEHPEDYI